MPLPLLPLLFLLLLCPGLAAQGSRHTPTSRAEIRSVRDAAGSSVLLSGPFGARRLRDTAADVSELATLHGDGLLAATWCETSPGGTRRCWQALSRDGGRHFRTRALDPRLLLRSGAFDPMAERPEVPASLEHSGEQFLVQLRTQVLEPWLEELHRAGARVLAYLPHQALIVRIDPARSAALAALPCVRWVGPHHALYRLEPALCGPRSVLPPRGHYSIQLASRDPAACRRVAEYVRGSGGTVIREPSLGWILEVRLDPASLHALAGHDDVAYIDRRLAVGRDTALARSFSGAVEVETFGYRGAGVRAEVLDGGIETNHPAFLARPPVLHGTNGAMAHGTSSYGLLFGDGTGNPGNGGVLSDAQGISGDFQHMGDRMAHTMDLLAAPYEAVFQSNAWGTGPTTAYTTDSFEIDAIAFQLDFLILQSQSNWGSQISRAQAWGKNVLSVGAINGGGTLDPADDTWAFGASIGPAADGRIKPDLAHFGDGIPAPTLGGGYDPIYSGTSAAVSATAGLLGIVFQMWSDGIFGNAVTSGASVFANRPHLATARALAINSATSWEFSGTNHDLTRMHQGWGRVDLRNLYRNRHKMMVIDETDVLANLQTRSYSVTVPACEPELRATLAWSDPPGTTAASQHRINNLDLRLTGPSGQVWRGNVGLDIGNQSVTGGTFDSRNTIENVWIPQPAAGVWTIEVIAAEINQDGHVETMSLDADYALVVRGIRRTVAQELAFDLRSCTGTGDLHLDLQNLPGNAIEGFTILTSASGLPLGAGPILGITPDHITFIAATSPAAPNNPFHWNGTLAPGTYPLGPISFPPGTVNLLAGLTLDAFAIAVDAQGTLLGPSNLVRRSL